LLLDGREVEPYREAERIVEFQSILTGGTLNFAGPRASGKPQAYEYTAKVIEKFIVLNGDKDF